jgi:hypothetical protein
MHARHPRVGDGAVVEEGVVERLLDLLPIDPDAARRVALRIGIDQQGLPLGGGK